MKLCPCCEKSDDVDGSSINAIAFKIVHRNYFNPDYIIFSILFSLHCMKDRVTS
jgi:hypothetical protein